MANNLQDQHRMFIQAFMWKKICSSDEVKSLHKRCHERNDVPLIDLKRFVEMINEAIRYMNMAIVKGIDEITGDQYYVLINTADNTISRLSAEYKYHEMEMFKKVVKYIIESDDGRVNTTTILNLSDEIDVSKRETDRIITKFCQDGWLIQNGGDVYFSTRAIVELQHFFRKHYGDSITTCDLCKNIVFQGDVCKSCELKLHTHCKRKYFESMGCEICPSCKVSWS